MGGALGEAVAAEAVDLPRNFKENYFGVRNEKMSIDSLLGFWMRKINISYRY